MSQTEAANEAIELSPKMLLGWLAMVLGMFMAVLDIQIVASSLTNIQSGLSASASQIAWVQTAYLIAEVIMIPLSGFLARLLSTKKLFLICALGFTASSVACAFAWSLESMIFLRVLQGFIGGGMIPSVFASIYVIFPKERQAIANVTVGLIVTLAPAIGPTLGGYITEALSWHWLFLINLLPGLLVIGLVSGMPSFDKADPSLKKGFDLTGLILMALFLGSLEFILDEGPKNDWFDDSHILTGAIVMLVSAFLFFWRMAVFEKPIVDLSVYKNSNFAFGCVVAFVLGIGLFGSVYSVPLFLARVQNFSALQIGQVMSISGIFMLLTAPIAGRLSEALDLRILLAIGLVFTGAGLFINGFLNNQSKFDALFWPQALRGIGLMFVILSANNLALGLLPPDKLSNASGLYNLSRNMGGAMGLAAINTLLDNRQAFHFDHITQWLNPARPEFQDFTNRAGLWLQQQGFDQNAAVALTVKHSYQESLVMAFNDVHLAMAAPFFLALPLLFFIKKPEGEAPAAH